MRVLTPAILSLAITTIAVAGFVLWASSNADRSALQKQTELVHTIVAKQVAELPRIQESVTLWDEAVKSAKLQFDKQWLDDNVGVWLYDYYGIDNVMIFDAAGRPIYTMADGVSPAPEPFDADNGALLAKVEALRVALADGAMEDYREGALTTYPQRVDFQQFAGRPAIVSVVPIAPDSDAIQEEAGTEYLHAVAVFLDQEIAARLGKDYLLDEAAFVSEPGPPPEYANLPLTDASGNVVTYLQWKAYRPGIAILAQTAPAMGMAFLVASSLVVLLVNRLWRSARELETGRMWAEHQATHDPLTGLPNRADFEHRLAVAVAGCIRDGTQVALLMLDLDRFKRINDTLGHYAGDELIRAVGQRLQELLDGRVLLLAHLGGDEFAIVYTGSDAASVSAELARQAIEAIGKPFVVSNSEAFVGASVGIAVTEGDEADRVELTRKADIALFEAKSAGRNRAVFYEESMNDVLQSRRQIEAELREALRDGRQLSVAYQPLYGSATRKIFGAEALVRWENTRMGQVSPAHFIPIAESSGLIETLGEFVLHETCALGVHWPGFVFAVNISPVQLRNPRFPSRVFEILAETGMKPTDLELEITENILLEEERTALVALHAFRQAGIRISLDDFGTGYSSLNYLKRYPVDRIKIDRSFVGQIARNNVSAAIVQAMITLAHALHIRVTAEGVETHEQMDILTELRCNALQGFLLSPPTTQRLLETMLREQGMAADDGEPAARRAAGGGSTPLTSADEVPSG